MSDASASRAMREADVANGENPADGPEGVDDTTSVDRHRTGVEQARENQADDPPA